MSCNVAFIGLGVMGYPMAGYISKAGHNVTVYNRTTAKAEKWIAEYKGSKADTPAKAAEGADFIFTCVGNDNDLREVSLGENGLFNTAKEGSVYIGVQSMIYICERIDCSVLLCSDQLSWAPPYYLQFAIILSYSESQPEYENTLI